VNVLGVIARRWVVEETGSMARLAFTAESTADLYREDIGVGEVVEYVPADQLRGAVDLLREIGAMAGAKANGADARAMAKRAREFVASLDQPGGQ
jgi:hypothetical protein